MKRIAVFLLGISASLGFIGCGGEGVKLPIGSAYVRAGEGSFLECTSIADAESKMIDYFFRDGEEPDILNFDYEVFREAVHAFPEEAMVYGFDKLRELAYIHIVDSEDGAVRAYSWDDLTGGTLISFDGFYQYRWKGKVLFDDFDKGEDVLGMSTRELHSLGDGHYLRHAYLREWSSMAYEACEAYRLTRKGLVVEALFDDGINDPKEYLGTEYNIPDWYFRTEKGEGYPWLFYFNAEEKVLFYPSSEDYAVLTDRYVPYKWDGKKMVSTPEVGNPFLHSSLLEYESLELLSRTSRDRVRIDKMNDGSYRYAAWTVSRPMSEQPDLVLLNGSFRENGRIWVFRNREYEYQVTESTLTVLKTGNPFARWDFE